MTAIVGPVAGTAARTAGAAGSGPRSAVSVATPAPVEPTESAESPRAAGVAVRPASAWWVLIAGVVGFVASATLTIEKIEMLKNPAYVPTCSINPVLSCGSVMVTHQASVFGFPNPLMGIAGFAVVIVTGVLAVTKVRLPQWYWVGLTDRHRRSAWCSCTG